MELPETRYAWNGDIALAYQVVGSGPVDLMYLSGTLSNVEAIWESRRCAHFLGRLASFSRLIVMDRRGTGCSERFSPKDIAPLEVMLDDVLAVLDAVGSRRCALLAWEETNFLVCMAAASRPDRVSHAILLDPSAAWIRDDELTWEWSHREWDEQIRKIRDEWGVTVHGFVAAAIPSMIDDERETRWLNRFARLTQSPGVSVAEMRKYCETDVRGILSSIRVPTLVLHRQDDAIVDARSPAYVAEHIPGATLAEVPGRDHLPWGENTDELVEEIEEFLTGERHAREPDVALATVLFTDIVGSTERQAALGDEGWKDLIQRHHALIRDALARWRGVENDTAGDGFYATFGGPARAIRCALEIGDRIRGLGLEIRAGIHTGECQVVDGKYSGLAVTIGARVAASAGASEILTTQTVKDLVAGSGLAFEDAGEHELKGVPERWRLYRVVTGSR